MRGDDVGAHVGFLRVRRGVADGRRGRRCRRAFADQAGERLYRLPTGRSRPYELTFWPSSVSSRTPSAAAAALRGHVSTAATPPGPGRGTMQYEQTELHPSRSAARPGAAARGASAGRGELVEGREVAARQRATGARVVAEPRDRARAEREVDERFSSNSSSFIDSDQQPPTMICLAGSRCFMARAFMRCCRNRPSAFSRIVQVLKTSTSAAAGSGPPPARTTRGGP